jgi:ABC-type sugar transport system permease subunit
MLFLTLMLASILNYDKLKFKGFFRPLIFLPCATALVSSAMIFRSFFAPDGIANFFLLKLGLISSAVSWLDHPVFAQETKHEKQIDVYIPLMYIFLIVVAFFPRFPTDRCLH